MIFCLKNKQVYIGLFYTFRFSSWPRVDRLSYNSEYFTFLEAYRGFKNTEWHGDDKGFIIPGIKIAIEFF